MGTMLRRLIPIPQVKRKIRAEVAWRQFMKSVFVLMLLTLSAFAQQETTPVAAACGSKDIKYEAKLEPSQHTPARPEPGKALVYFIQDIGVVNCLGPCLTTRIGLDGAWVGANQHNSYFSVSVEPGEHHICASPQSRLLPKPSTKYAGIALALAHFTAEAGKVYYFRTRFIEAIFDINPIDSDQATYLMAYYPLSVSHAKP
jgi:uncharacterized protein DUF2846